MTITLQTESKINAGAPLQGNGYDLSYWTGGSHDWKGLAPIGKR